MHIEYDWGLVALSILLSVLAAYTALDFAGQVSRATGLRRGLWLIGGAVAMGTGIWSMHFVGMLAFHAAMAVHYDLITIFWSVAPAMAASGLALAIVSRPAVGMVPLVGGGVVMGLAIAAMHYLGMLAVRVDAVARYNLVVVAMSIILAMAAAIIALGLTFYWRQEGTVAGSLKKVAGAIIMGLSVPTMHYVGMHAVVLSSQPQPAAAIPSLDVDLSSLSVQGAVELHSLASVIGGAACGVIGIALLVSLEAKIIEQASLLNRLQTEIIQRQQTEAALQETLQDLKTAQVQLIHSEKLSSLGQLVAGLAHEVNNPLAFILGNIEPIGTYLNDLLCFAQLAQRQVRQLPVELQRFLIEMDLEFITEDTDKVLLSIRTGAERIRDTVMSLRHFSRLDEASLKPVSLAKSLEEVLILFGHRLEATPERPAIRVHRAYGELPRVECYPAHLNQAFFNLIENAIDAIDARTAQDPKVWLYQDPVIQLSLERANNTQAIVRIADNGIGFPNGAKAQMFDPFFTTKPLGQGKGMGLPITQQVVVQIHKGTLLANSVNPQGCELLIELPICQSKTCFIEIGVLAESSQPSPSQIRSGLGDQPAG